MTGAMTGVQFADGFDGPDRIALGLSAPQLAIVVGGGLGGYGVLHSPLPGALRVPIAVLLALLAAVLGWGRMAERPLLDWCWLAMRFASRPRRGGTMLASNGGDDKPPAWLHNLKAQPRVEVQVASDRRPATARVLVRGDPDFERLWRLVNENNSDRYDGYQSQTQRPIPVVVLTPG